jgi:hypothetical protein
MYRPIKGLNHFGTVLFFATMFSLLAGKNYAQSGENLPAYTRAKVHFGFILAYNSSDFAIQPLGNLSTHFNDTLKSVRSTPLAGFNLGIVSELMLTRYLKLRFVPDLAFSTRQLVYSFMGVDTFTVTKTIQSTFIDFPLDLKLISKRQKNFEAYVLAGVKYITDLASQKNVDENLVGPNEVVRLIRNDYAYEAGAGIEFYLPYFKFGLEFKLSRGVRNLLIKDNTVYTQSIESLKSEVYLLSLTFEG